jgi:FixJ family two-component response regulator
MVHKLPVSVRTVKRYRAKILWRMMRYELQNPNADHQKPPPIDVLLAD